jgi:hypothetical protein
MTEPISQVEAEFTLLKRHFSGIKRRAAQRYRCPLATLGRITLPDGNQEDAWAHNLSESGIGLNLSHSLEPGTGVLIRLRAAGKPGTLTVAASVVHSTEEVDGSWRIGCRFADHLSPEQVDAFLL